MYLPRGLHKNSFSATLYNFVVSTANSVIKPATILSSQKYIAWVNLLFTCCNCSICTGSTRVVESSLLRGYTSTVVSTPRIIF